MPDKKVMSFIRVLSSRARFIFKAEGIRRLGIKAIKYIVRRYLYHRRVILLQEHTVVARNEADFLPRLDDYSVFVVSSSKQLRELAEKGYRNLDFSPRALRGLDNHAVVFLIFVGKELAHSSWVMLSEEGKRLINPLPFKVDFEHGEACTGDAYTAPRYQNRGLMSYGLYLRFEYLRKAGIVKTRNTVRVDNKSSLAVGDKFNAVTYAKLRYLKILWFKSYKETALL